MKLATVSDTLVTSSTGIPYASPKFMAPKHNGLTRTPAVGERIL